MSLESARDFAFCISSALWGNQTPKSHQAMLRHPAGPVRPQLGHSDALCLGGRGFMLLSCFNAFEECRIAQKSACKWPCDYVRCQAMPHQQCPRLVPAQPSSAVGSELCFGVVKRSFGISLETLDHPRIPRTPCHVCACVAVARGLELDRAYAYTPEGTKPLVTVTLAVDPVGSSHFQEAQRHHNPAQGCRSGGGIFRAGQ